MHHLFAESTNGDLFDTRQPAWSKQKPLRYGFKRTFSAIQNASNFKATLRAGAYAWPGGYPLYFICDDGGALCFACARKEARNVIWSLANKCSDGWRITATDVNWEDSELYCEHCNKPIESAYGSEA